MFGSSGQAICHVQAQRLLCPVQSLSHRAADTNLKALLAASRILDKVLKV